MTLHVSSTTLRRLSRPSIHQHHLRALGRHDELVHAQAPSLKDLEVAVSGPRSTTADDVMRELEVLRRRYASVVDCSGRPARLGDAVVVDIASHVQGEVQANTRRTGVAIALEESFPLQDLARALVGAKVGGSYVVSVDFPHDFEVACARGLRLTYTVKVRQVVRRELPATDDETFLRTVDVDPAATNLAEALWARVTQRRRRTEKRRATYAVLKSLLRRSPPIEVPRDLLDAQVRRHWMLIERPALNRWCFARPQVETAFMRWMATTDEAERISTDLHIGYLLDAMARELDVELDDDEVVEVLSRVHSGVDFSQGGAVIANGLEEARHIARVIVAAEHVMGYATVTHRELVAEAFEETLPGRRLPPMSMDSLDSLA